MLSSLRRKPSGAPPNTLKKSASTATRKSTSSRYNEHSDQQQQHQPWATAHLFPLPNNHPANPLGERTAIEARHSKSQPSQTTAEATMPKVPPPWEEATDTITPLPPSTTRHSHLTGYTTSPSTGHSNVSLPARPPRRHSYSECFDLEEFATPGSQSQIRSPSGHVLSEIRSPSGNMLSADQAAARADRPSGIRERQETIRRKVREAKERQRLEEERERELERERSEEMGLGNCVEVIGDVQGRSEREVVQKGRKGKGKSKSADIKVNYKAKGKKFSSLCGCL